MSWYECGQNMVLLLLLLSSSVNLKLKMVIV